MISVIRLCRKSLLNAGNSRTSCTDLARLPSVIVPASWRKCLIRATPCPIHSWNRITSDRTSFRPSSPLVANHHQILACPNLSPADRLLKSSRSVLYSTPSIPSGHGHRFMSPRAKAPCYYNTFHHVFSEVFVYNTLLMIA